MDLALLIIAWLLAFQGLVSLIEGISFARYVRRSVAGRPSTFTPKVVICAPVKGGDPNLEGNLRALFAQDYPSFRIVFSLASADDDARPIIEKLVAQYAGISAELLVTPPADTCSEKVSNLISAVEHIGSDAECLVFFDSDAEPPSDWLRHLVSGLADENVGAATGYRWYLPASGGFWSAMLSAWNGTVATMLGDHGRNFAWGGSTAILRDTFECAGVAARWRNAVSDDYVLTRAVKEIGKRIVFEPRCLILSRQDATFGSLLEFTTRQVTITRVYNRPAWLLGFISHLLFCFGFFGAGGWLLISPGDASPVLGFLLALIYLLGSVKGWLRISAVVRVRPEARTDILRLWWMFILLWPLVSLLFAWNFVQSAFTRRINWRGIEYEMRSPDETVVHRRSVAGSQAQR